MTQFHRKWQALVAATAILCLGFSVACGPKFWPDLDNEASNFTAQVGSDGKPVSAFLNVDYSDWNVDKVIVEVTGPNGFRQTLALTRETDLVGSVPGLPLGVDVTVRECWWKYHPRADGCTNTYTVHVPSADQLLPPAQNGGNNGGGTNNGGGNNNGGGGAVCDQTIAINAPVPAGGNVTFGAPYLWSASAGSGSIDWAKLTFYSNVGGPGGDIPITTITGVTFPYAQTLTLGNDEGQDVGAAKAVLEVKYQGCDVKRTEFSFNLAAPDNGSGDLVLTLNDDQMFYGEEFGLELSFEVVFPAAVSSANVHITYPLDPNNPGNPPHTSDVVLVGSGTTWHIGSYLLSAPPGKGHAGTITFSVTGGSYSGAVEGDIQ